MSRRRFALGPVTAVCLSASALAQATGNEWVEFIRTDSMLGPSATAVSNQSTEVDFDFGDLDKDGWTDLVVVRKEPVTTSGKRTNLLLMNENGVLVDRTSLYATASLSALDNGFDTPTNDRDVVLVDVDNDTWLDVVTAPTLSDGDSKRIGHPRVASEAYTVAMFVRGDSVGPVRIGDVELNAPPNAPYGYLFARAYPVSESPGAPGTKLGRAYRVSPTSAPIDAGVTVSGSTVTVDPDAYAFLEDGETEVLTFSYDIADPAGATVAQILTVTIEGADDTPPDTQAPTLTAALIGDTGAPDGITIDTAGRLYSARWGGAAVCIHSRTGELIDAIALPVPNVTSCCFGGDDLHDLYITTAGGDKDKPGDDGGLFRVTLKAQGRVEFRSGIVI